MSESVMTIRTERTPNPNSLKYNLGRVLIPGGSANFPTVESSESRSPLAKRLFKVDGVTGVFIGSDFVTITKGEECNWQNINEHLAPALESFFESGDSALTGSAPAEEQEIGAETADPELVARIKKLIEEKVRPAVAQDGGDISYRGFENGIVYLEMKGACSGCPSSSITLKQGVEGMLMHYCPEVTAVEAI
ncbi:MAG: Fe-S cluster biogenesis protein NfuA [Alphaproteobacteria bacterium]|jgi:Fe-S cluster biogenesis protein NfuA